ncbi:hypothetical protein, partial [Desulfovibrio sp.]|uniref:hypothetical protein n=1 Tax=Desulfovibrio sp. TaxID=885 RepID=UPI0023C9DF64
HGAGLVSGILLAVALLGLFDGLLAEMRGGTNQLELLPGESLTLSGPAVLKNPVASDLVARMTPPDAPLRFSLEGFFTGYWFGNGMWRGEVMAAPDAAPGSYGLRITFKGAVGQAPQVYTLIVHADARARREASLSFLRRLLGINPFVLAAVCGGAGVLLGGATYAFGRRHVRLLAELGCSEVYRAAPAGGGLRLWCLSAKAMAPRPGTLCPVLDAGGAVIGEARAEQWRKGSLELAMGAAGPLPEGCLVCLRTPATRGL